MTDELPYRPCVGIALFNADGHVFVGERIDTPGAWQMPQGGIDDGEQLHDAFFREMREEIGTDKAEILEILDRPLRYKLPPRLIAKLWNGRFGGQEQHWIAARFTGTDSDIDIRADNHPEFSQWKWVPLTEILDLVVPFKQDTYMQVMTAFGKFSSQD